MSATAKVALALFLSRRELCARWGISRVTSYRMQRDGYLPKPIRLAAGVLRWSLSEIEAMEQRAATDRAKGGTP